MERKEGASTLIRQVNDTIAKVIGVTWKERRSRPHTGHTRVCMCNFCVCLCVLVFQCTHVCVCACVSVYAHACLNAHMLVSLGVTMLVHLCLCVHACLCACMSVSVCVCICVCVCAYVSVCARASVASSGLGGLLSVGQLDHWGGHRRQWGQVPVGLCVLGAVGRVRGHVYLRGSPGQWLLAAQLSKRCGRAAPWMVLGKNNKAWSLT